MDKGDGTLEEGQVVLLRDQKVYWPGQFLNIIPGKDGREAKYRIECMQRERTVTRRMFYTAIQKEFDICPLGNWETSLEVSVSDLRGVLNAAIPTFERIIKHEYLPSNRQHEAFFANKHNKKARDAATDDLAVKAESIFGPAVCEETESWLQEWLFSGAGQHLSEIDFFETLDKADQLRYLYQILKPHALVLLTISHYDLSSGLSSPSPDTISERDQLLYDLGVKELNERVDPASFVMARRALFGRVNEEEAQRGKRKLEKEIERMKMGSAKQVDYIGDESEEED
ncbi:hypothetical protein BT69DRAFT_837917 [Atractiella rhizophila]|nr:hypothetical protein BT69DRAFT_837917 [Atractiella rhizophila]